MSVSSARNKKEQMKPTAHLQAHCQSYTSPRCNQSFVKELASPCLRKEKQKFSQRFAKKTNEPINKPIVNSYINRQILMKNNEPQLTTSYIKHLAVSGLLNISARIKSACNLTGKCFEMPNVSYT
jgi:hypothetical protein